MAVEQTDMRAGRQSDQTLEEALPRYDWPVRDVPVADRAEFYPGRTLHVDASTSESGDGSAEHPFATIQEAADIALPGDTVLVAPGIYHENVSPRHAGEPHRRIAYRSATRGAAVITGAERVTGWKSLGGGVWCVAIPNTLFGAVNPYTDIIAADWVDAAAGAHRGQVFLGDKALYEVHSLEDVRNPKPNKASWTQDFVSYTWFTLQSEDRGRTLIWANFHDHDPNREDAEISVRPECFMPQRTGIGWITLDGFTITKAATQWAPPTAYQDGMVGPHWSKGWIIENCDISHSRCSGISLGKKLQPGNENKWMRLKTKDGAQTQREVVMEASYDDWDKEHVGSHVVRGNTIHDCGQTGIVGHLGCVFSLIEDNDIFDINIRRDLSGEEIAGIKLHAAIDVTIRRNHIHHCSRGLWLDWQAQGTRVSANVFDHNTIPDDTGSLEALLPGIGEDIEVEVSHGPTLIDNNLLLSERSIRICSQGLAIVHNLIAGSFDAVGRGTDNGAERHPSARFTPYHVPHGTRVEGFMTFLHGDVRLMNNLFVATAHRPLIAAVKAKLYPSDSQWDDENWEVGTFPYSGYPSVEEWRAMFEGPARTVPRDAYCEHLPVRASGNVFLGGAQKSDRDTGALCSDTPVRLDLVSENGSWHLSTNAAAVIRALEEKAAAGAEETDGTGESEHGGILRSAITTQALGRAFEPQERFENPDGTPIALTSDILGRTRSGASVEAGPFASLDDLEKPVFRV